MQKMEYSLDAARDYCARLRRKQERLEWLVGLGEAASSRLPRRMKLEVEGRLLSLTPALARVLVALAGNRNARRESEWHSAEQVLDRINGPRKKAVSLRAIIQAIHRLRTEFSRAKLTETFIASGRAGWKLHIPAATLAALQERSDVG